ncbi:hypothetical protein RND71_015941 [Anisodus tanguticus]|uniref:2-oxoglutarate-dependent dioxygenase DAO n=1 Tax=Anisodus tanguticus TaxID=243964 RepID=A0AAE1VC99_9SOLA|nr:hypothetical protein RND71_015941 [Anisodus tanguticus]
MACKEEKIPAIDFGKADLRPGTPQWESTKAQLVQALEECGCFEAIYDSKLPPQVQESMFAIAKEIFEYPTETKLKNASTKPLHGYFGRTPDLPSYESLCITDMLHPGNVEAFANIFWPQGNPEFCNEVRSYTKRLVELDEMMKRMVLESLGVENYIDEFLKSSQYFLRFSHYEAAKGENTKNKLRPHTDGTFLAIIAQNQVNGLQLMKKDGEWMEVNIAPNSFIVMAGDCFMAWTNGRIHSPVHKVATDENIDRYSIPFSSIPKLGHIVEAPKELVNEEHPLLFKPFEILNLFGFFTSSAASGSGVSAFKTYCGA